MAITVKNSFNAGDLITALPGLQNLYFQTGKRSLIYQALDMPAYYYDDANHPVKTDDKQVCMNKAVFDMMKPLLEAQDYIEEFRVWKGEEVIFDLDKTRQSSQIPLPGGDIHAWPTLIFPQFECDLSTPWLKAKQNDSVSNKIIINRTARYNNPYINYFFLKYHLNEIVFAGLPFEHEDFCSKWGLNIPILPIKDFLELAEAISSCRFFIGNQSMMWHIADAMKVKRILEVCVFYPNSFPTGKDGYAFVSQEALQYRFDELLKETQPKSL